MATKTTYACDRCGAIFDDRNSPPKVDPLVEKIIAVQHRVRIEAAVNCTIGRPDTVLREAEAIAAEVRKFAAIWRDDNAK